MEPHADNERSFETITAKCAEIYRSAGEITPCALADAIMRDENIPMHNFAHHYLVPAVLMTLVCRKKGCDTDDYARKMAETEKRAKNVLPAFCGLYGACGAAIGVGIFMSVYTGTTPLSKDTWGMCNMSTVEALKRMAEIGGPRCCKRNTFLALQSGSESVRKYLGIDIASDDAIECGFSKFNAECLKEDCPFYKKAAGGA